MSAVHVTEQGAEASAILMAHTALKWCATEDDGVIARNWPRLSSGEELLWRVLEAVNGDTAPPSADDLNAGLDEESAVYARAALAAFDKEVW